MEDENPILDGAEEDQDIELPPAPTPPPRKKAPARVYFGLVCVGMLLLLLLAVIALGSFAYKQKQLSKLYAGDVEGTNQEGSCILFADGNPTGGKTPDGDKEVLFKFHNFAPCHFIYWALSSGTVLAGVFLLYSIVLTIAGPRILSFLRLVDCVLSFVGFLGYFAFSITITAGINKTCSGFVSAGGSCARSYFTNQEGHKLKFYSAMDAAKNCCWIATVALFIFGVWNVLLVVAFFRQRQKKAKAKTLNNFV